MLHARHPSLTILPMYACAQGQQTFFSKARKCPEFEREYFAESSGRLKPPTQTEFIHREVGFGVIA